MKAPRLGATLTSGLALLAILLAALQMLVLFHAVRPAEAALQPGTGSVVAPSPARRGWAPVSRPEQGNRPPAIKPPREPHPPLRQFRQNDFGPHAQRKAAA
jgi:hypothetical protein